MNKNCGVLWFSLVWGGFGLFLWFFKKLNRALVLASMAYDKRSKSLLKADVR